MEKILILDSNSLINRAFYALPLLSNSLGVHTNGILGYLTMFFKMCEEFNPKFVVATFDRKAKTFRHKAFEGYKAGRKSMPNELREQMEPLKQILRAMNINIFEIDGFEADDLIGTFGKIFEKEGYEPIIVTGDRDALQLCTYVTKVIITKKGISEKEIYDTNKMLEIYGVTPSEFVDVKALMGDKSDNIPGVSGIGEKGALKLIGEYKNIENLYNNLDNMKESKLKTNLCNDMDLAFLSKKLSKISCDVPIDFNLEELVLYENYDKTKVYNLFKEYDLNSLINKLGLKGEEKQRDLSEIKEIKSKEDLDKLIEDINNSPIIFLVCEFENSKSKDSIITSMYINVLSNSFYLDRGIIDKNQEILKLIFESNIEKVCIDSKDIYKFCINRAISFRNNVFDLGLASYVIDPSKGDYDILSVINRHERMDLNFEEKKLCTFYLERVYNSLKTRIEELSMNYLYYEIEHPLSEVLANVEINGFKVSKDTLDDLKIKFEDRMKEYSESIYEKAGEEFNINSPKQLSKILFEKLDLPVIKKTKTGYSTNVEVLEALEDKHDIIKDILNYRQVSKLLSTYVIGLIDVIDVDDKIHTSFNQTGTTTGRLSSTDPNLQNIPIRYPLGREIRKVFISDNSECVIFSADYSQIELRVLAHLSEDSNMVNAFKNDLDIHKITASEIFSVDESEVTSDMRSRCKAVNFGIVYGITDFALAKDLKISKQEAREYMDKYFEKYQGVKKYLEDTIDFAKERGYVKTIFNRIRYVEEIRSSNKIVRSLGERLAMNTPIQGSAADIMKLAMIRVYNRLKKENVKSTLILQVHDELVLNVYKDEVDQVSLIVIEEMENCFEDIKVPLKVNTSYCKDWFNAK